MNKPPEYHPQPIDTSSVILPDAVKELTELLARNAHDVWAQNRLRDGWRWGAERNDERKEHPCLIPYDELTETEKEYDRVMAIETLKTITALGFHWLRADQQ